MRRSTYVSIVFLLLAALIFALHVAQLADLITNVWKRPTLLIYIGICVGVSLAVCLLMDLFRRTKRSHALTHGVGSAADSFESKFRGFVTCAECENMQAVVHLVQITNGKINERHLCLTCARKEAGCSTSADLREVLELLKARDVRFS